ncbi:MAG: site-specific DNA-methyltransferase [Treponema sp.]|nr:site-specific DNA-methyltransferase [Treponema sp.]
MDKLKMHSKNAADENYKKLAKLFPSAVTETVDEDGKVIRTIDKEVLMKEINTFVSEDNFERYVFSWPEKTKALNIVNAPTSATLRPFLKESTGRDGKDGSFDTNNVYIQGDNLEVLKVLQETYLNKIKMIYIDPPYNTGNDFIYEDDYAQDYEEYLAISGQIDKDGNKLKQNPETNGRFHTDWLNMIYPRIKLARNLLTDDGAIFISIDEGEIENLKKVCNEIFNEKNYVNTFMWLHGKGKKDSWSRTLQQYIVVYAKNKTMLAPWVEKKVCDYEFKNPDNDPKGPWFSGSLSFNEERSNPESEKYYTIKSPSGVEWTRQWMISKEDMDKLIAAGDVSFGKAPAYDGVPRSKIRPGATIEVIPNNIIDDCNTTRGAENYLTSLFGSDCFSYPKPYELIQKLASFMDLKDATVLDFFSGSATTAESIMRLNIEKPESNTKFIMVQLPENLDDALETASNFTKPIIKNAIKYLDNKKLPHNLCEIGKERLRLAGKKLKEEFGDKAKNVDIGFRSLKLDSTNMKDVYYYPTDYEPGLFEDLEYNIKEDRSNEDLLFQVMLELGVPLDCKFDISEINDKQIFKVNENFLITCFDNNIDDKTITEIAKMKPYYYVMKDNSIANDSVAMNFEQIFNTYSPDTKRKVL